MPTPVGLFLEKEILVNFQLLYAIISLCMTIDGDCLSHLIVSGFAF